MTEEEKREVYNRKVQHLIVDIDEIIKSSLQKAEQSDKIMARLREEYVFAKNSYINEFGNAPFVTIDPYSDYIKLELEEDNIEGIGDDEYCRIPAYSFGPFDSKAYFDDDTFKIFWLIKEPFCENRNELVDAYYKNDSDYYNQPKWYATWDSLEYNAHINAVKISQIILAQLIDIKLDNITNEWVRNSLSKLKKEDLTDMDQVMKHICFIEVNHFPGLALNPKNKKKSKDDLIGKWAQLNEELIKKLIEFYNPVVIIGGMTLGHFFPKGYKLVGRENDHSFGHIKEGIRNGVELFKKLGLTNLKDEMNNIKIGKDYLFNTKEGIILIDSSHPSRYSKVQSQKNSKQIKAFMDER